MKASFVATIPGCAGLICVLAGLLTPTGTTAQDSGVLLTPKAFRVAAEKVRPSVVIIEAFGITAGTENTPTSAPPPKTGKKRGRGPGGGGISGPGEGPTTGTILSPDGWILSSTYNFIRKQPVITVVLHDGTQHVAQMYGRDDTRRLCLLKIDGVDNLPVPTWIAPAELKVGQYAISMGMGYGSDDPAISSGIVSAKRRISGKAIQTDANISPANYGGPLFDLDGRIMGICVPLSPGSGSVTGGSEWYDSGIGFAIPIDPAASWLKLMKEGQTIRPGLLGLLPAQTPVADGGVKIQTIQKDHPADRAGLQKDDIIIAVNNENIVDLMALRVALGRFVAGDKIEVTYRRGKEQKSIQITLSDGMDDLRDEADKRDDADKPKPGPKKIPFGDNPIIPEDNP